MLCVTFLFGCVESLICGNGKLEFGEVCDKGVLNGDGVCTVLCTIVCCGDGFV